MTCIPLRWFRSFANEALHVVILCVVAFNHGAHSVLHVGLGVFPSHALSISALHFSPLSKEESKYLFRLVESDGCPQIVSTKGDWSESLCIDVVVSIRPPPRVQVLYEEFVNARDNETHSKLAIVEGVLFLGHFLEVV
jgi:hypothetical protein